jgi:hypothetical protein
MASAITARLDERRAFERQHRDRNTESLKRSTGGTHAQIAQDREPVL